MDERRKRLRFRAWRRGFREIDLILGGFADANLDRLSELDLDAFEALLAASDQDVYAWIVSQSPTPTNYESALLQQIRAFAAAGIANYGGAA